MPGQPFCNIHALCCYCCCCCSYQKHGTVQSPPHKSSRELGLGAASGAAAVVAPNTQTSACGTTHTHGPTATERMTKRTGALSGRGTSFQPSQIHFKQMNKPTDIFGLCLRRCFHAKSAVCNMDWTLLSLEFSELISYTLRLTERVSPLVVSNTCWIRLKPVWSLIQCLLQTRTQ